MSNPATRPIDSGFTMRQTFLIAVVLVALGHVPSLMAGLPFGRGMLALIVGALLYILPGVAVAELLLRRHWPDWARLIAGLIAGVFIAGLVYYIAARIGVRWLSEVILVPMGIIGAAISARTVLYSKVRIPRGPVAALGLIWILQVATLFPIFAYDCRPLSDGSWFIGHTDTAFHWAIARLSRTEIPTPTLSAPTDPYAYHAFPHFLSDRLSVLTGLSTVDILTRLMKPGLHAGIFLGFALLAWVIVPERRWAAAWIALALYCLGAPYQSFHWLSSEYHAAMGDGVYIHDPLALSSIHFGHYVIGTSGPFFNLCLGLVLSLAWWVGGQRRAPLGMLALLGIVMIALQGFAAIFAQTGGLALCFWLLVAGIVRQDWRPPAMAVVTAILSLALQKWIGATAMDIRLRLFDSDGLYRQFVYLLQFTGFGWGWRVLWPLGLFFGLYWRRDWVGAGYAGSLVIGWLAGFVLLDINMRNELHFLNYAGPTASIFAGVLLARGIPRIWQAGRFDGKRLALPVAIYTLLLLPGFVRVAWEQPHPEFPAAALSMMLIIPGVILLGINARGVGLQIRRSLAVLLLFLGSFSGMLGNFGHRHWTVSYIVPTDLVAACREMESRSLPGERIFSLVRSVPGHPVADERMFAVSALTGRAIAGDANRYAGVRNIDAFNRVRFLLDQWREGRNDAALLQTVFDETDAAAMNPARFLLLEKPDVENVGAALGGADIVYTNDNYTIFRISPGNP